MKDYAVQCTMASVLSNYFNMSVKLPWRESLSLRIYNKSFSCINTRLRLVLCKRTAYKGSFHNEKWTIIYWRLYTNPFIHAFSYDITFLQLINKRAIALLKNGYTVSRGKPFSKASWTCENITEKSQKNRKNKSKT